MREDTSIEGVEVEDNVGNGMVDGISVGTELDMDIVHPVVKIETQHETKNNLEDLIVRF